MAASGHYTYLEYQKSHPYYTRLYNYPIMGPPAPPLLFFLSLIFYKETGKVWQPILQTHVKDHTADYTLFIAAEG